VLALQLIAATLLVAGSVLVIRTVIALDAPTFRSAAAPVRRKPTLVPAAPRPTALPERKAA